MLSSHPGTCYLCKEKCRYYPRTRGIGDHEKVQGHPQRFLETPIPSAIQPPSPTLWLASIGTYTQKAGDPTPVPRAGERMYVPTRRKRKGEGSGRSGAGSGCINKHKVSFLETKSVALSRGRPPQVKRKGMPLESAPP